MSIAAPDTKRRALGKGLDSLLPRVQAAPVAETEGGKPKEIPLEQLDRNPFQTRSRMNEDQLEELAASISANGVVQPILVRPIANGRFQLIAGERRWRASQLAGKTTIPAILRQVSDEQAMEITIVENLQRADLNPMEQARAYERLSREFHMTQEQMAVRTGKDRATVSNFLRLLRLPESVQTCVESGDLSFGHARTLLAFEHAEDMEKAAKRKLMCKASCIPSAPPKKSPSQNLWLIPTYVRYKSNCSALWASKLTSKITAGEAKSLSNTPSSKTSTRCLSNWRQCSDASY